MRSGLESWPEVMRDNRELGGLQLIREGHTLASNVEEPLCTSLTSVHKVGADEGQHQYPEKFNFGSNDLHEIRDHVL